MKFLKKILIIALKQLDLGSAISVRLTKLTGKSKEPIHPKHFLTQTPWFTNYLEREDMVLDLGCGNGQSGIKAAKFAKKVIGVDINETLLGIAKLSATTSKIKNVKFETANLEKKLKYKKNQFDKVIFLDVLEHLKNRDQLLNEIKRVLRPQGLLFLGVPNSQTSWKKLQRSVGICSFSDPDHKIEFSEEQIIALLKKHGFSIKHFGYGYFDTPLRGLFDVIGGFSQGTYKKLFQWRRKKVQQKPTEASGFEIVAQKL